MLVSPSLPGADGQHLQVDIGQHAVQLGVIHFLRIANGKFHTLVTQAGNIRQIAREIPFEGDCFELSCLTGQDNAESPWLGMVYYGHGQRSPAGFNPLRPAHKRAPRNGLDHHSRHRTPVFRPRGRKDNRVGTQERPSVGDTHGAKPSCRHVG